MFSRRDAVVALCSVTLAASAVSAGSPAAAAPARGPITPIVCTGHEDGYAVPSLGLLPKPTRIEARARYTCTTRPGEAVAATGRFEGISPSASCVAVDNPTGREVVRYADGRTSVIAYDSSSVLRLAGVNIVQLQGRVTDGVGEGQSARRTLATIANGAATECVVRTPISHAPGRVQMETGLPDYWKAGREHRGKGGAGRDPSGAAQRARRARDGS
ncbi:hypothetical protein [Streptomyces sp. NPDC037389]|uniref:hypothetical protein n=1 Tax=Streptomyces sp. NPDC037389 TaxID=3155369 RepID=UPI003409BF9E